MKKALFKRLVYIFIVISIALVIILVKLLYSPLYLIYWREYYFPQKEKEIRAFQRYTENPDVEDIIQYLDKFQPDLTNYKVLNETMQKVKWDFQVAKFFGLEDRYNAAVINYSNIFMFLAGRDEIYFIYLNSVSNISSSSKEMQKYLDLRVSTKNLENEILEEQLKFIKYFEDFYDYLQDVGYLEQAVWYKGSANVMKMALYYLILNYGEQICFIKDGKILFEKMKKSYNILKKINPEVFKMTYENYKSFLVSKKYTLDEFQKALDECK